MAFTLSEKGSQFCVSIRGVMGADFCLNSITLTAVWRIDQGGARPETGTQVGRQLQ